MLIITANKRALADSYGVGSKTIERSEHFAKGIDKAAQVSPAAKQVILSGAAKIPKTEVREIRNKSAEEIAEIAQRIESGTYEPPRASNQGKSEKKI